MGNRPEQNENARRLASHGRTLLALLLGVALMPPPVLGWYRNPASTPLRSDLPNAVDLMESGLYWLQDLSGIDNLRDPASIIALMEDQAARYFDFAYIAYLVAGPEYAQRNLMQRAHFQNRIRDQLFTDLARKMGLFDVRMPTMVPLVPRQTSTYTGIAGGIFYHRGGPRTKLVFHFYLSPQGWRIYDVTSNGVSAVDGLRRAYLAELFEDEPIPGRLR